MKELLGSIPEDIYPIISDYAKIIIPAFLAYLATKYSLMKPRKYEIKEKQFNLVYLPLYLLAQQYLLRTEDKMHANIATFINKVDKLIYKNYPYVHPKTLKLFKELKLESSKSTMNRYFIMNFYCQIETDYNLLKKELGYPCDSIINIIKRSNRLDRILFFSYLFTGLIFIFSTANFFLSLFKGQLVDQFFSLLTSAICALLLYIIYYMRKH